MSSEDKPDYSEGFDGCPWCGEIPEIKKHFREDEHRLRHNCKVLCTVISVDWMELKRIKDGWNQRKK